MAIIGKINDEVLIDDLVLRKPETLTRWIDPTIEEKDKEIERLNNVIKELEKEINNQLNMTRKFDKYNEGYFNATLNYYNKLKALKEGK